ncbi:extracellular solute-binding protein [Pararhizobium mangrovi]|uniref:ABC transporter substrate-binding protein n=1 Tax=Pararhizobium mangrovi TaxID=2590452 RepID=A0A506TX97_9HYPH|nr:extracellular solute-binding protein [Pararhizobium mangrovi]TPW25778.1 ABC transporter substrate-binding protein [Pararhizobium mangrovi]
MERPRVIPKLIWPKLICAGLIACATSIGAIAAPNATETAGTQDAGPTWHTGIALIGKPKYPSGFDHFDYVNVDAPKGGTLNLSESGSFDTLNPILSKGDPASGVLAEVFEPLFMTSEDDAIASYALIAEAVSYPDDISSATFKLRRNAHFSDGTPVTPEDVVWSFRKAVELNPQQLFYYKHVKSVEKSGDHAVTFHFDEKNNRELPSIVSQMLVLPKHWWTANGRSIARTTLEAPIGSGPYTIASIDPGAKIVLKRDPNYWGKDLNVNVGRNNFGTITYTYYSDRNVEFQAFKSGNVDFWAENEAKRWATQYGFPAVKQGRITRETVPNPTRATGVMIGFVPNLRRDMFKDPRVRRALNHCFNFEELNRTIFYGQYERVDSYFFGTPLAAPGVPTGREKEILETVKDTLPADVFTKPYTNPKFGSDAAERDNLREAVALFRQAGYEIRGGTMVNAKTGDPFTFQILLNGPIIEKVALPFAQELGRIGVKVDVRTVDPSSYINRLRSRNFDMIYTGWPETLSPGNEQADFWGSAAAKRDGSRNYAGISDPGIDTLIRDVIFAKDRDELVASTHALDRALLSHHYVVPSYSRRDVPIAFWKTIERPKSLPEFGLGFPDSWWAEKAGGSPS